MENFFVYFYPPPPPKKKKKNPSLKSNELKSNNKQAESIE